MKYEMKHETDVMEEWKERRDPRDKDSNKE